jgi:sec-independent protein translocase protein TatC
LFSGEPEKAPKPPPVMLPLTIYQKTEDSRLVQLTTLNPQEAFFIYIKAALVASVVLSSPWVFYQIWMFVAAGLYPHEKKYVHIFLPVSLLLFLAGASLAFFAVFRFVLDFLFWFNGQMDLNPDVRISEWLSFVLLLPIGFGISFQLPLVMFFLERIHVFSVEKYLANWRISILVIFIISMILTPADPYSMCLMAVPLCILYYFGIALCKWMPRGESPFAFLDQERDKEKLNV